MEDRNGKASIIIPVYNALEELAACVESIRKHTDLQKYPLILVDDASTDERISSYLESMEGDGITAIRNASNQGFSASINNGIQKAGGCDVILLNSDTQVTEGWADKLAACACQDPKAATVTPLSNNATLCSVPGFCQENEIPEGYGLSEYAALIERISLKLYPEIPVANGFCMYVKREVIDQIGAFDAETFGKGYGEENDFCFRATQAGYHHLMCDDTYILHTGTKSFASEEKQRYIRQHEKIIADRYPEQDWEVRIHCRDNPNAAVSENIRFWAGYGREGRRQTVMYLLQSDFRLDAADHTGGTQLHVRDLTQGLRESFDILVAARDGECLNLTLYTKKQEFFFRYYIGALEKYESFRSSRFAELYGKAIDAFGVGCVHIHHTRGLSLELYAEATKRGIPVLVTIHDYYYACPSMQLLDPGGRLCIGRESEGTCRECLWEKCGIAKTLPYLQIWRRQNAEALQLAARVIAPSESARQIFSRYFPEVAKKTQVIGHGVALRKAGRGAVAEGIGKSCFHVAFLGGVNAAKGYQTAKELIRKRTKQIHWYLLGAFETEDPWMERRRHFTDVGSYAREELPGLMEKYAVDLVCILSVCPETYSYTLSEALACGVPVLVTDCGALGERVRQMGCGWTVCGTASAEEVLGQIQQIRKDKAGYQEMVSHIRSLQLPTVEDMCMAYRKLYQDMDIRGPYGGCGWQGERACQDSGGHMDARSLYEGRRWLLQGILNGQGKYLMPKETDAELEHALESVQERLLQVENSLAYKIGKKIISMPVPMKGQVKKIVLKLYRQMRRK